MRQENAAVCVGFYYFGIVPAEAISGIETKPTRAAVRFEGENYDVLKATTPEGTKKFEKLLNDYGKHPIEDFEIEQVIMSGVLEMTIPGFDEDRDSLLFGGYCFTCDGNNIPFDFNGSIWNIDQEGDRVTVTFDTGRTPFGIDYFLDENYEEEYKEIGLRINDITAELLAGASEIVEFAMCAEVDGREYSTDEIAEMGGFEIKALFFDNATEAYVMNQSALDAFNERHAPKSRDAAGLDAQISEAKTASEAAKERDGNDKQQGKNDPSL